MDRSLFLGIDVGTSGLKCLAVDENGRMLAQALREYMPYIPRPGWAEQDPETWVQAAVSAAREVVQQVSPDPAAIAGIGFSGQMHSAVFLDAAGRPIRPAILWLDSRSTPQVETLRSQADIAQLAHWLGNPVMPGFMLSSLLWLKDEEPHTWDRLAHVLLPKDYVRFRFTGELGTDFSDASSTALLDVRERRWCRPLLEITGIPLSFLPSLHPSTEVAGTLQEELASQIGLRPGIPVVFGSGDQAAQAVGNGIVQPGPVSCTIGTGGQLFSCIARYRYDPDLRVHVFCHAAPWLWHWLAATLTAGQSLRWLRDEVLGGRLSYSELADAAATVEPGAEGLIFLPYLAGERTPHMDPCARGVFYGLSLRHTWRHMVRAVMEGVIFSLLDGLDLMRALGTPVERIIASGGASRHPLWLQLQADIFDLQVVTSESQEAAALGAALMAGVGAGLYSDLSSACSRTVHWSNAGVQPRPEIVDRYRLLAARYRSLYPALKAEFHKDCGQVAG